MAPRGGARPGAGRKPTGERTEMVGLRLRSSDAVKLRELAEAEGLKPGTYARRVLEAHLAEAGGGD